MTEDGAEVILSNPDWQRGWIQNVSVIHTICKERRPHNIMCLYFTLYVKEGGHVLQSVSILHSVKAVKAVAHHAVSLFHTIGKGRWTCTTKCLNFTLCKGRQPPTTMSEFNTVKEGSRKLQCVSI